MNVPNWKSLFEAERFLSKRFATLRDSRTGPVFFIEHGLSATDAEELRDAVSRVAKRHPIQTSWWRVHPLPLIVAATEVGYGYRGTGTDFWPNLESALEIHISPEARQRVRDLFAVASSKFRGARPPVTPWTQAFRLIAWPITHALVPLEFHRHLSAAVANLQSSVQELDDDALHRAIRIAVRHPSVRFEAFLENGSHAVPVIRALLGGEGGEISQQVVGRINLDLTADRDARIDIEIARRRQKRLRKRTDPKGRHEPLEVLNGLLELRLLQNGRLVVLALLPALRGPNASRLRRTLRRRRLRHRLWGSSSPVPSESLLSGLPFPVTLQSVPSVGTPLLPELNQLGIDTEQREILERLRLDFRLPLLFASHADGRSARLVRGKEISAFRVYWLLTEVDSVNKLDGLPRIGSTGAFTCYLLDPSVQRAAMELGRLGYRIRQGISVWIAGAPPLDTHALIPKFLVGDERVVVPRREHPLDTVVGCGSERVSLDGELVRVRVAEGEHVLKISNQDVSRRDSFKGVQAVTSAPLRACWIELSAEERTVQALLGGAVAIKVDSLVALEGLTLSLDLAADSWRTGITAPMDPLPQVLAAGQEPWKTLLDDSTRSRILQTSGPIVLHARVGHLAAESWTLERSVQPCWWTSSPPSQILESELGTLETGQVPFSSPASRPVQAGSHASGEAVLLAPHEPDESAFGPAAMFVTFCTAPSKLPLQPPPMNRPRLRRARWGEAGSIGIQDLAEAWLRWSLAQSENLTAEVRRRQAALQLDRWLAELACGEAWAFEEEKASAPSADPWKILPAECRKSRLGLDELVELSQGDEKRVLQLAIAEIRRTFPDLWARVAPPSEVTGAAREFLLDEVDYAELDAACARGYEQLAERYRQARYNEIAVQVESADPGAAPDQWDPVLQRVLAMSELWTLGEFLLPTDKARWLMSLDVSLMPLGEIAEELHGWAIECKQALAGEVPSVETVRAILALWISPRTAISLAWQDALDILVSERALARAARYLALRTRSIRPLDQSQ